jgi:DUF971 family protein
MRADVRPLEIRNHRDDRWLEIAWSDGVTAVVPHRLLREACRCALCLAAIRSGQSLRAEVGIRLNSVEPYGPNALRLCFDDGHSRGLYPFAYLRELPAGTRPVGSDQQENVLANPSNSSGLR